MTPASQIPQNGHVQPGQMANGQAPAPPPVVEPPFERSVVLRQSPRWARYVIWGIVGVTVSTITWACVAKIEEAVPAQGKLEPRGVVQPVQAPVNGVVQTVMVQEGDFVEQGQVLIALDPTTVEADLKSAREVQKSLREENAFYRAQLSGSTDVDGVPVELEAETVRLTSNRAALVEENRLYRAMVEQSLSPANLSPAQQERLQASLGNLSAQMAINDLEKGQISEQLDQVNTRLANAVEALKVESDILDSIAPLAEQGAVADLQLLRQEQEVNNRRTEVDSLREEQARLILAQQQADEQGGQIEIASEEELLDRIAANENQMANIDSQLTKIIVENDKTLEEIDAEISRLKYTLANQELRAPLTGQVFNLKANQPGYVANATEPILEIVPDDTLVARVDVTNRDIGFVNQQFGQSEKPLEVDVRIDSFPFSEFGDIKGEVVHIASDAMPPDEINPYYRFPVEIELESQRLGEALPLQSGMSVSANIKLRKRRVITILSDLFVRKLDSLRSGG